MLGKVKNPWGSYSSAHVTAGVFPAQAGTQAHSRHCPFTSADTASCVLHFHKNAGAFPGGKSRLRMAALRGMPNAHHPAPALASSTACCWLMAAPWDCDLGSAQPGQQRHGFSRDFTSFPSHSAPCHTPCRLHHTRVPASCSEHTGTALPARLPAVH